RTSGKVNKQIIHTINGYGNPDTLHLDPLVTYDLTIHSLPEVTVENIHISPGTHNIIGTDLPRGTLELKMSGSRTGYEGLKCIIRQKGEKKILHVQDFNSAQKYLAGAYDLEILTLP